MPNINLQFMISQNLLKVPFSDPNAHYIFLNYFEPLLYGLIGGKSLIGYAIYSLVISIIFLFIFLFWFVLYHGKNVSLEQNKLFAAITFPVFMIPFYWIGMDGMTLLLMLMVLININRISIASVFSFILGIQHFEQSFIAFGILLGTILLHYIISRDKNSLSFLKTIIFILLSVIGGKLILMSFFFYIDVGLSGDRSSYLENHLELYLQMWKNWWFVILWTLFAAGWFLVILNLKKVWPLLGAAFVTLLLTAIVGDQTRVGLIILFPSLFYWLLMDKEVWQNMSQRVVLIMLSFYLLVPVVVVWGQPHKSLLSDDLSMAKQMYYDGLKLENIDLLIPFHESKAKMLSNIAKPLVDFKAKISVDNTEIVCLKEKDCVINVNVKNTSLESWNSQGMYIVNLGYHITSIDGEVILFDGIRTSLPHEISSGVSLPLQISVKPNLEVGKYLVAIDIVQEGISWFGEKDNQNILNISLEIK